MRPSRSQELRQSPHLWQATLRHFPLLRRLFQLRKHPLAGAKGAKQSGKRDWRPYLSSVRGSSDGRLSSMQRLPPVLSNLATQVNPAPANGGLLQTAAAASIAATVEKNIPAKR